ncbi:MAG TPA: DUF6279 family lipoprotein [Burkholderiaceae bacterium]
MASTIPCTMRADRSTGRAARLAAGALAFLLVLATGACSAIKIGYNNADSLLAYSLDGYFDLDEAQSQALRQRLRALLAWHRATQLQDYAQLLGRWRARVETAGEHPVSPDEVIAMQGDINARLATIADRASPELARMALTLTAAQIEHCAAKMAKDAAKAHRELDSRAGAPAARRVKVYSERAQEWLGPLHAEQVGLVRASVGAHPELETARVADMERRQRELVELLSRMRATRPQPDEAARWLRGYFAALLSQDRPGQPGDRTPMRRANAELTAALINSATPTQRQLAAEKLGGYARDLTALSLEGVARP